MSAPSLAATTGRGSAHVMCAGHKPERRKRGRKESGRPTAHPSAAARSSQAGICGWLGQQGRLYSQSWESESGQSARAAEEATKREEVRRHAAGLQAAGEKRSLSSIHGESGSEAEESRGRLIGSARGGGEGRSGGRSAAIDAPELGRFSNESGRERKKGGKRRDHGGDFPSLFCVRQTGRDSGA